MRVAVVGAGLTGSSCAWRFVAGRSKAAKDVTVSIFEMGRGAGGRAGTRHVPDFPGLHVNHGAPLFHLPSADVSTTPLISALLSTGTIAEWQGTYGRVDVSSGSTCAGGASRGEADLPPSTFKRYVGVPHMSSVASGCLDLAKDAANASMTTHFAVRVKDFIPQLRGGAISGWEIVDSNGKSFGVFDWVVVSGATPALERWRAGFKEEPPVYGAAERSGSERFRNLVRKLDQPLDYEQTHVVSVAWDVTSTDGEAIKSWLSQIPFKVVEVDGDENLGKVIVQQVGPTYAVVVLHSTVNFARKHKNVKGASSFVSVSNNVEGSVDKEAPVADELLEALRRLVQQFGESPMSAPTWGPALHRWGAAFPHPDVGIMGTDDAWVLPNERFVLAGDFLAPPTACVATAFRSGIAAGDALLKVTQQHSVEGSMQSAL